MNNKFEIFIFSWNTESIRICESLDDNVIQEHRSSTLSMWYPGQRPDFWPELAKKIKEKEHHLAVFCFQEDSFPGSYFHSHFLPEEMPKLGYKLLSRSKMMGLGVTTIKSLINSKTFLARGLRNSIYVREDIYDLVQAATEKITSKIGPISKEYVCSPSIVRNKGALASYVMVPSVGLIAFINAHLPFSAQSLIDAKINGNWMLRQNDLNLLNTCFNNIVENLIFNIPTNPDYVIFLGDLNYRVQKSEQFPLPSLNNDNIGSVYADIYKQHDELLEQMRRRNIYIFEEGINNEGPSFLPTCKLRKKSAIEQQSSIPDNDDEIEDSFKYGKFYQRAPSWCDRILYQTRRSDAPNLKCCQYDRFIKGKTMKQSDHAAVYSTLFIETNPPNLALSPNIDSQSLISLHQTVIPLDQIDSY